MTSPLFFEDDEINAATGKWFMTKYRLCSPSLRNIGAILKDARLRFMSADRSRHFRLVKALRHLGMATVVVGSQTGSEEDYNYLKEITDEGTIICDDTNPLELSRFILEKGADLLIGWRQGATDRIQDGDRVLRP